MKPGLAKRLQKLEHEVSARRATVLPESNAIEIVRGWLQAWGVEPEESLAETLARALGFSSRELRDWLGRRACAQ